MKITIRGATGRMGRLLLQEALEAGDLELAGAVTEPGHELLGLPIGVLEGVGTSEIPLTDGLPAEPGVIVDFSQAEAVDELLPVALGVGAPVVIGTTGLSDATQHRIDEVASQIPIFVGANMSKGVHLLKQLVEQAAAVLAGSADIEIVEIHHRFKRDAPSGTALELARRAARGAGLDEPFCYGREGLVGERPDDQIALHAVRMGDVVGEHTVTFGLMGERIELVHKAHSRKCFARGALDAARFLAGQQPGRYSMDDLIVTSR